MKRRTNARAILDEERRRGRLAGAAGLLSVLATVATVLVASSVAGGTALPKGAPGAGAEDVDRAQILLDFDDDATALAVSTGLRCVALLLMIAVGVLLYRMVRTRDERAAQPWLLGLTFAAPILMCVAVVAGFVAFAGVAGSVDDGPRTVDRATQLLDDSGGLAAAQIADLVLRLPIAAWIAVLALSAMRVGLLTRFLGYWGAAAGACLVLLAGTGDAMLAAWIASVALLLLGYWPGGRPAAWDSTSPQEIESL